MIYKTDKKKWIARAALTCAAVFALSTSLGVVAACGGTSTDDDDDNEATSRADSQLLKNGNFEYYDDVDGNYIVYSPDNWSKSSSGTSSYTTSGVISTNEDKWSTYASAETAVRLYLNNLLSTYYSDSDLTDEVSSDYDDYYTDYNGLAEYDLPYKDVSSAIDALDRLSDWDDTTNILDFSILGEGGNLSDMINVLSDEETVKNYILSHQDEDDDEDEDEEETTDEDELYLINDDAFIANPYTHDKIVCLGEDGEYYYLDNDGAEHALYLNTEDEDDDTIYTDMECTEPLDSSVLMIHNYLKNGNGTGQYYSSSTTITLEANTAAEVSVWVKTSDLYYHGYTPVKQDRGAYIEVTQTVGSSTLDSFKITDINTEKINPENENNGWVEYTIYVQACDYADTTISINLGLGDNGAGAVEGYAFFDDVSVTKYTSLTAMEDALEISLSDLLVLTEDGTFATKADDDRGSYCTLLSEGDEKVFEADTYTAVTDDEENDNLYTAERYSDVFVYYIDLTSSNDREYIELDSGDTYYVEMGPTVDTDKYVVSENTVTVEGANASDLGELNSDYYVNSSLSSTQMAKDNSEDVLAVMKITEDTSYESFGSYATLMQTNLSTVTSLPGYIDNSTSTIVILSTYGAPYTATLDGTNPNGNEEDGTATYFTIDEDQYYILSFWLKTSDMAGKTAATITLTDNDDKDNSTSISCETTDVVTDIDDDNEDIYNGWVQCFFYIYNDTEETHTYTLKFQFGNTTIKNTSISSYLGGWAAISNLQLLEVTETEYGYAETGTYTGTLTFTDSDDRSSNYFDAAISDTDIKTNIVDPANYEGVNGASTAIIAKESGNVSAYDYLSDNDYAGLINADYFEDYIRALFNLDEDAEVDSYIAALLGGTLETDTNANYSWLKALLTAAYNTNIIQATVTMDELWSSIFGSTSVQPLLIVNNLRTYTETKIASEDITDDMDLTTGEYYVYDEDNGYYVQVTEDNYEGYVEAESNFYTLRQAVNYGFMSDETSVSSDSYSAITVRVKVVGDTTAYIYLTDTTADRDILTYEIPKYTFWYDDDGNVLKEEPTDDDDYDAVANIAYKIRSDGLYDLYPDSDDYQYANLYSLTPVYMYESEEYFIEGDDGIAVQISWDELEDDVLYYSSADMTSYASHYLVNDGGTRLFMYTGEGTGLDAIYNYYYYDNDDEVYKVDTSYSVKTLDTSYATPRYTNEEFAQDTAYYYEIANTNGDWATVNFLIHTGSESRSYRLELWSGERDQSGVTELTTATDEEGNTIVYTSEDKDSYVIFDYSYLSLDSSTYTDLMDAYTSSIINAYQDVLASDDYLGPDVYADFKTNSENIAYYEKYAKENIDENEYEAFMNEVLKKAACSYVAKYYMFTLYDSSAYLPFNEDTASDEETGYDYSIDDFSEMLAYFSYTNTADNTYTMFIDYSALDQDVELSSVSSEEEEEETESDTNIWLLVTSIVLVVALLVTLISMLVREIVKKAKKTSMVKRTSKNMYIKRKRYVRQYTKENGEVGQNDNADEQQNN